MLRFPGLRFTAFRLLLLMLSAGEATRLRAQAELGGCPLLPATHILNTPVDRLPVDRNSDAMIARIGANESLRHEITLRIPVPGEKDGHAGGIPYVVVPADQPLVPIALKSVESDPGPYPFPPDAPIEDNTDQHVLALQQGTCKLYEVWLGKKTANAGWEAEIGAVFDLRSQALRPDGWSSSDAAGLPILPLLVRWEEVKSGEIRHAIRITAKQTRWEAVWPARHVASNLGDPDLPPMGQRFRLKADFDISDFHPDIQVILRAMKKYGVILADNGWGWYITGAPDGPWENAVLAQLERVKVADFEAVDSASLNISINSGQAGFAAAIRRVEVPYAPEPNIDFGGATAVSMTLRGEVRGFSATRLQAGQTVSFLLCQDERGQHRFQWPGNVHGGMEIGLESGRCSAQSFVSDGDRLLATGPGVKH